MTQQLPILYTFLRCPWAMRARLALAFMGIEYESREVDLKNKPAALLQASPKGTVPVLILSDGTIIDESLDIMYWAMPPVAPEIKTAVTQIISTNDNEFKFNVNHYKYPTRYPDDPHPKEYYRTAAEQILQPLEQNLVQNKFLFGDSESIADLAIFPLVRQFSMVEPEWFAQANYPKLKNWLQAISESHYYNLAMNKPY